MTDRPIIFSAPMIRALLEGRKTQTRRVLKPPYGMLQYLSDGTWKPICTKWFPGDRLWVRETWSAIMNGGWTIADARRRMFNEKIVYRADGNAYEDGDGWWPSIYMPREFSRLTLTVTDVRVQRLQDITEADAVAEGIERHGGNFTGYGKDADLWMTATNSFRSLWNSIHGPQAWDANPWVAALTFTVEQRNIDE